jgi:UDP-N-acetylmuramate--alanine ligase
MTDLPSGVAALDLSRPQRFHIVGIGGAGMSAIATVLAAMGHDVSGSDLKSSRAVERLSAAGISVQLGHDGSHVAGAGAVAISTAVPANNPEVVEARRLGIPVYSRAEVLSAITRLRRTLAVAGTHGKTTTSSMLALILVEAGMRPSFVIGGDVNDIGTNAVWDAGEWLVVEADESDGTFLTLDREIAIVTSLEPDHLEHYGSFDELRSAFGEFARSGTRALVFADDSAARALIEHAPLGSATFGRSAGADYVVSSIESARASVAFDLTAHGEPFGRFSVAVPGEHNALNAACAIAAAVEAGAPLEACRRALARFAGVARRFEFRGERNGVVFVDDYAHLPGEVRSVLRAAKTGEFGRLVAVFQPHRYSRTQALAAEFRDAFVDADIVAVTAVYASGEAARPGVSGQLVVDAVLEAHPDAHIVYVPDHEGLLDFLRSTLRAGDLCLLCEAGDLTGLPEELLADDRW